MSKTTKRERQKENRERARIERERMMKRDRRMKTARSVLFLLVPVVILAVVINVLSGDDSSTKAFNAKKTYTATIETSEGTIVVALDAKTAPKATERFVQLADKHYYDGLCFDRLSPDFVIQGGSPKCDQQGGEGHSVVGEVPTDHYPVGSLAAAKTGSDPAGTFDSQFFIVTGSKGATLPNDYARFGTVISGIDVAQKIEKMAVSPGTEKPAAKITITRIRIAVTNQPATATTTTAAASSTTASTPPTSAPSATPESSTTTSAPSATDSSTTTSSTP